MRRLSEIQDDVRSPDDAAFVVARRHALDTAESQLRERIAQLSSAVARG
jgi:hypothetical protein